MFIDEVEITFTAGDGGNGKASFYPGKKSGPDGGNGGDGGNIYLKTTSDLMILNQFMGVKFRKAENGLPGGIFRKSGKYGNDLTVNLPLGCILTDKGTNDVFELNKVGQKILICKGGKGGRGTYALRSPTNTTPLRAEYGQYGQERNLKIVLKLIADYGLIGLPNTGKSSLLNELTAAHAKVADYPFTTLEPNLGSIGGKIIADIPGLIKGASKGRGLGVGFLKHIEKVSLLLHCISAESINVENDYRIVRAELKKFNPFLIQKPEIILLTKTDTAPPKKLSKKQKLLEKYNSVLPVSILDNQSLDKLKKVIFSS